MTVYVVQNQHWVDHNTGRLKPKFDFTPAEEFGELEFLLKPGASPFDIEPALRQLHERLADFSDDDWLICVGNPALLAAAAGIAAFNNGGNVNLLQWSGAKRRYIPVGIQDMFNEEATHVQG